MSRPVRIFIGSSVIVSLYFLPLFDTVIGKLSIVQVRELAAAGLSSSSNLDYIFYAGWIVGLYLIISGIWGKESPDKW